MTKRKDLLEKNKIVKGVISTFYRVHTQHHINIQMKGLSERLKRQFHFKKLLTQQFFSWRTKVCATGTIADGEIK